MDSSRVIIVAKECHQGHQGHHFIKLQSHLLFLRPPCTHVISLLVHELVSPSSIVSTFYPAQKPGSPTPPMPFLPPVTLPSSPSSRALGPAHRSRIGPRRVLPRFHDLFIEVSVSPMLPRFSLRLPCFRARDAPFRPQCKGNAPNSVMMK